MKKHIKTIEIFLIKFGTLIFHPKVFLMKRKIEPCFNYVCEFLMLDLSIWQNFSFVDFITRKPNSTGSLTIRRLHIWHLPLIRRCESSVDIERYDLGKVVVALKFLTTKKPKSLRDFQRLTIPDLLYLIISRLRLWYLFEFSKNYQDDDFNYFKNADEFVVAVMYGSKSEFPIQRLNANPRFSLVKESEFTNLKLSAQLIADEYCLGKIEIKDVECEGDDTP